MAQTPTGIGKLKFENFRGIAPNVSYSAYTECNYDIQLQNESNLPPIKVVCSFFQTKSWMKAIYLQNQEDSISKELLIHEEGHFKICLIGAKRLQAEIGLMDLLNTAVIPLIANKRRKIDMDVNDMNIKYEEESNHGRNKSSQLKWNSYFEIELQKLKNIEIEINFI